jgi:hypothetical protein
VVQPGGLERGVGLPSVVIVVARVDLDVLGATKVVSTIVTDIDRDVLVTSLVDVDVELLDVIAMVPVLTIKDVETICTGIVSTVVCGMILTRVAVGTDIVCTFVVAGTSVALSNGANVESGSSVKFVTEGKLVGNGGTSGCPSAPNASVMLCKMIRLGHPVQILWDRLLRLYWAHCGERC